MYRRSLPQPDSIVEMVVDRPFMFMVLDATTGLVLCQAMINEIPEEGKP